MPKASRLGPRRCVFDTFVPGEPQARAKLRRAAKLTVARGMALECVTIL
jgi:hypothetical protein